MIVSSKNESRLRNACDQAREKLLNARDECGVWTGELSASALSTATAISALASYYSPNSPEFHRYVTPAIAWLIDGQDSNGGWGDTRFSQANISTTMLARSAFAIAGCEDKYHDRMQRADEYIAAQGGIAGLLRRYGRDKTFAVPILANAAIAGQVSWSEVSRLPFELACFPQNWYRFLQLPVVSYAIPALVAVGQAVHHHRKSWNPITRSLRNAAIGPSLRVLRRIQPASGGYLEAIPLTSFVTMNLISCGQADHVVTQNCLRFIKDTVRDDGSWPIDTNLATWNTTLALNALVMCSTSAAQESMDIESPLSADEHTRLIEWLLDCQNTAPHPFTGAAPGGWGWSNLSGAVPDADDTPGALLALHIYRSAPYADVVSKDRAEHSAVAGVRWLLDLQNRDGGWPTFCRGWGKLPFDRSGTDLTAHVLRALHVWQDTMPKEIAAAMERGWDYLAKHQKSDGSWVPLWFGNQHQAQEENPIYGTAKCLLAYCDCGRAEEASARNALRWLAGHQNEDGGWGGDGVCSSVEETALAVDAIISMTSETLHEIAPAVITRGVDWLVSAVEKGEHHRASPIGLYFAKLWYYESTYPLVFTAAALTKAGNMNK